MTDLIAATNTISPTASSVASQTAGSTASQLSGDFETFLKLLTAQMKNQDPTNPIDNTEFVAQLASFSAVEQQVATNEKLQSLIDAIAGSELSGLTQWVGTDVLSKAATQFDGLTPIEIAISKGADADNTYVSVRDADNKEVRRLSVSPQAQKLVWDGLNERSITAEPGTYTFRHIGVSQGEPVFDVAAETFSAVAEARSVGGAIELRFADGTTMKSSDVTELRAIATPE